MAFRFYSADEVAGLCHVEIETARRWFRSGELKGFKKGGTNQWLTRDDWLTGFQVKRSEKILK